MQNWCGRCDDAHRELQGWGEGVRRSFGQDLCPEVFQEVLYLKGEPFYGRLGLPKLVFAAYEAYFEVHDRGDAFRANRHVDGARGGGEVRRSSLLLYVWHGILLLCNSLPGP